jgi:hypothetical protein
MLPELAERDATGDVARIYAEIRALCAVPYVSSMQRHLATRPGWLEWAWAAIRPVFADGAAQTAAWRLVGTLDAPPLPRLSPSALRLLGVDARAVRAIRAACDSFVRVSPTNLVFSGLLRRLLAGERPGGAGAGGGPGGAPPAPGARPPPRAPAGLVDPAGLPADQRAVLMELGTVVDGRPFVPGLYRMLANWPPYLAHVATVLRPRLTDPATGAACRALLDRIDGAAPALLARLPALPATPPAPPREEHGAVLAALERYRETSPQMVVFGALVRDALPAAKEQPRHG